MPLNFQLHQLRGSADPGRRQKFKVYSVNSTVYDKSLWDIMMGSMISLSQWEDSSSSSSNIRIFEVHVKEWKIHRSYRYLNKDIPII